MKKLPTIVVVRLIIAIFTTRKRAFSIQRIKMASGLAHLITAFLVVRVPVSIIDVYKRQDDKRLALAPEGVEKSGTGLDADGEDEELSLIHI